MQQVDALRLLEDHGMNPVPNLDGTITAISTVVHRDGRSEPEHKTFRRYGLKGYSRREILEWLGY